MVHCKHSLLELIVIVSIVIIIFLLFLMDMLSNLFYLKDLSFFALLSASAESSVLARHLNFQRFHGSDKHDIN